MRFAEPPDAREVTQIAALVTVDDASRVEPWLARCVPGSSWRVQIRTAGVAATVLERSPLGTFAETVCTCIRLRLELPVPVEPGLRFRIFTEDDATLTALGVVRPWGD